jgi:hypothetical protein
LQLKGDPVPTSPSKRAAGGTQPSKAAKESGMKRIVTKEDLRWALQRAVTLLGKFCNENPPLDQFGKKQTFKQWIRGESREQLEVIENITDVRP